MRHLQFKSTILIGQLGLLIVLLTISGCSGKKTLNNNSDLFKSVDQEKILNDLVDRHLSKLNEIAKSDFDSTALVVNLGLDSMAKIESFKPYWLNVISELKSFNSGDNDAIIEQISTLANERGDIYFLSAILKKEDEDTLKIYFGIEELEQDTLISWTTKRSLTAYMRTAPLRRNSTYWTKNIKKNHVDI